MNVTSYIAIGITINKMVCTGHCPDYSAMYIEQCIYIIQLLLYKIN